MLALVLASIQLIAAPVASAAPPIFQDDFSTGNMSRWTSATRVTVDTVNGSPAAPSARMQVTNQSASAYLNLTNTRTQACMSVNVNLATGTGIDLFRLRTATGGPIVKAFVGDNGTLRIRNDFGGSAINSGAQLGTGWHNVELCGTVGTNSSWEMYRDGVRIVNGWTADVGTTPIGRIQIGDTASKTFTMNVDDVVFDDVVGIDGDPQDTTPPTRPGQPTGVSSTTSTIQLSWTASDDASLPVTYRIYRDNLTNPIGETTQTSFTDTNLPAGSAHTYSVDAVDVPGNVSQRSLVSAQIQVMNVPGGQPVPGHTALAPQTPRTNVPRITAGEITDLEYIGNRVFIVGTFTQIQNNTGGNSTTYNQPYLASYNLNTGLVDTSFRPTFAGGGVTEAEASPDGTKLFIVGRFNTVNGVTKRKVAALNPNNGALLTGFTANANSQAVSVDATNTTVYIGGDFTTINGAPRASLAAVNANTGQVVQGFQNDLGGGIGVDGRLTVQALKLTHDETKLLVVHTGRRIAGQDRYGVGLIDTQTNQLLPWRSTLWDDNLQFVGGIQRIYAGDIAPNDEYFVVTSGSGGDRPPISDTAIAFPIDGGANVEPLWISRAFDSIYSVAISEVAVYLGGHQNYMESPTAPDPWPGLTDVGYGRGQGLAGYGLGDDIVIREHIGAVDPITGKSVEWNPGSTSYEGNKAMLAMPRGVITGGDGNTQGGQNTGRVAFYDFNSVPAPGPNETAIVNPIEGRVEEADVPFTIDGTATATSGVQRVQMEIRDRDSRQYLQDNLTTWGAYNTFNATLASPGASSTTWSVPLTISGNRRIQISARTFGNNGSDASPATKKFETFGLADATPTTSISGPNDQVIPTMTFTVTGSAQDDNGVNSITFTIKDAQNRYLQDDGTVDAAYNTFRGTPDVVGGTNTTWSWEWTLPYESEWTMQAIAVDTAGQSDLRSADRTWIVNDNAIPPEVAITTPAVMNPPTSTAAITMAPGSPLTFSGSATDDEGLNSVEIQLRNSTTREQLATDGSWGTDVQSGWYRISPNNLNGSSYNWSYTTPFNLRAGTHSFSVRAVDDLGLSTSSNMQGRLTINVQVPGDVPPNATLSVTGTQPNQSDFQLDLAGTATDDFGVASVGVSIEDQDSSRYLQPNGTLSANFALLPATLASSGPGVTSTTWTLSVTVPGPGDYSVTAFAFDTADQQDPSQSGATARYPTYPNDQPPAMVENLFSPSNGAVFTESRILVSGRVEDDQQIAQAQVAIRNAAGLYMNSSGQFSGTSQSWRTAFLNSPGSPGSNFAYTSPPIPAGMYTVFARGVDQHGFTTTPPYERTVEVQAPAGNLPPVASFTYTCEQNVCTFDGRSSTDENAPTLLYSWSFGNGSGSGPLPTRTYTSANTYNVTLTVTDEYGFTNTSAPQAVTITEPTTNLPPQPVIAEPSCSFLVCNFSSVGTEDPNEGDTFSRVWNWGDGTANSTSTSPSHTFPAAGEYTVTLTVTDGWGDVAFVTRQVTVSAPPPPPTP
jgi:hypothetical protein